MKALPDLTNVPAMAARGRRAALFSARKEACEQLRHAATTLLHNDDITDVSDCAADAREAINRIEEVARLMSAEAEDGGSLVPLLKASIAMATKAKAEREAAQ